MRWKVKGRSRSCHEGGEKAKLEKVVDNACTARQQGSNKVMRIEDQALRATPSSVTDSGLVEFLF